MAPKPAQLRELAAVDVVDAIGYYRQHAGEQSAVDFVDAVERAVRQIRRNPQIGTLRFAYELAIPDLRAWPVATFPYAVFYVVANDRIDVWRVLHTRRDIPSALSDPDPAT